MNAPTLGNVFDQLVEEQHLPESDRERIAAALAGTRLNAPWFVQILSVVGAWIAAIMLFASSSACVGLVLGEPPLESLIFFGIVLCGIAFWIKLQALESVFFGVFAMVIAMVGQMLFVVGIGISTESIDAALGAALILQGVFLAFYPGRVLRFLSWITIVAILVYFIVDAEFGAGIYLLAVLLAAVTAYVWLRNPVLLGEYRTKDAIRTASYALPLSMFALLLIPLLNTEFEYPSNQASDYHQPLIAAVGLLFVVVALEAVQLRRLDIPLQSRETLLLAISTALVFAPSLWTPGIPAAVLVLLLGYWRGSRVLMGMAAAFLCLFVAQFYFNLDTTLLVKSYMMMATGLVLLGLRYVLFNYAQL
jgi:hypothetical protein